MRYRLIALLISLSICMPALATKYKLDPSHSRIGFKVRNLGIAWVTGNFNKFEGTGEFDEKTRRAWKLKVKIDAASLDTNEADRDKHLRSSDFFDVKKYPNILFVLTNVEYKKKIPTKIHGKITIRGVTKKLSLDVVDWGGTAVDPWGNEKIAFEATGKIDRRDFGLKWNKLLAKGLGLIVGNEVKLILEIQGTKLEELKKVEKG